MGGIANYSWDSSNMPYTKPTPSAVEPDVLQQRLDDLKTEMRNRILKGEEAMKSHCIDNEWSYQQGITETAYKTLEMLAGYPDGLPD